MLKLLRNGTNGVALYLAGKSASGTFLKETIKKAYPLFPV
jgi:hypothetical protein